MSAIYKITPRKIFLEDLSVSTHHDPGTSDQYVKGVGTVPLTPISMVLYSAFGSYANDAAAAADGLGLGALYYNSTDSKLHARIT